MSLYDNTLVLWTASGGLMQRVDGVLKYVRTGYDMSPTANNLDGSATATQQPRLVGGIAPGSKYAASNQNGEARYFTHTPVSFAANEAWSVSLVLDWNCASTSCYVFGKSGVSGFSLKQSTDFKYGYNISGALVTGVADKTKKLIGKRNILTISKDALGVWKMYYKGNLDDTITDNRAIEFDSVIASLATSTALFGKLIYYRLQSGEMTPAQVAAEAAMLATRYPEMESVVIGSQTWATRNFEAVATPMGNVIPEMQAATAVEKITNAADREFSSDTGWWSKTGGSTINNAGSGVANILSTTGELSDVRRSSLLTLNKFYKIAYDVTRNAAGGLASDAFASTFPSTVGSHIVVSKCISITFTIKRLSGVTDIDIDNISIQELGWSNSTEIYDAVYAATAGTAAQKEYAALKEAAMWCYYNNDPANGAIYGKLYNWYAAKLLDLDMITAGFGWKLIEDADWTSLNPDVSDNALKHDGETYWAAGNTGTNTSGLTLLPSGYREWNGDFKTINNGLLLWNSNTPTSDDKRIGAAIRLKEII